MLKGLLSVVAGEVDVSGDAAVLDDGYLCETPVALRGLVVVDWWNDEWLGLPLVDQRVLLALGEVGSVGLEPPLALRLGEVVVYAVEDEPGLNGGPVRVVVAGLLYVVEDVVSAGDRVEPLVEVEPRGGGGPHDGCGDGDRGGYDALRHGEREGEWSI